jgi:hypothetical protein
MNAVADIEKTNPIYGEQTCPERSRRSRTIKPNSKTNHEASLPLRSPAGTKWGDTSDELILQNKPNFMRATRHESRPTIDENAGFTHSAIIK